MAQTYNIPKHRRGDTWNGINKIAITIDGTPIDLSGCIVVMELREDYDAPVAFTLSTTNSTILINPELSSLTVPPVMVDIPPMKYRYDLQVTNPIINNVTTYMEGDWEIYFDITK
jgi:hypothetical protein